MFIIMQQCFLYGISLRSYIFKISTTKKKKFSFRRYTPGGEVVSPVIVNACVHVVMYLYYALAAMHIQRQQLARVKLFVTIIQVKFE
jgi:hypothetical protein